MTDKPRRKAPALTPEQIKIRAEKVIAMSGTPVPLPPSAKAGQKDFKHTLSTAKDSSIRQQVKTDGIHMEPSNEQRVKNKLKDRSGTVKIPKNRRELKALYKPKSKLERFGKAMTAPFRFLANPIGTLRSYVQDKASKYTDKYESADQADLVQQYMPKFTLDGKDGCKVDTIHSTQWIAKENSSSKPPPYTKKDPLKANKLPSYDQAVAMGKELSIDEKFKIRGMREDAIVRLPDYEKEISSAEDDEVEDIIKFIDFGTSDTQTIPKSKRPAPKPPSDKRPHTGTPAPQDIANAVDRSNKPTSMKGANNLPDGIVKGNTAHVKAQITDSLQGVHPQGIHNPRQDAVPSVGGVGETSNVQGHGCG